MTFAVNRRIEAMIQSNLYSDVVAQVLVLGLCLWWLPSPWMWAIWGIRWIVLAGIVVALRSIRANRIGSAIWQLTCGHIIGVLTTVTIAPVLTPLAMLVLVGDLFMATYLDRRLVKAYLTVMVIVVGVTAALSFQSWTGLVDIAPATMTVSAIVVHTIVSGMLIPRSHRQNYAALRHAAERLTESEVRLQSAIEDERYGITRSLNAGPVNDLDSLIMVNQAIRNLAKSSKAEAAALSDSAATQAQHALRSLRRVSHGIFPESLKFGLSAALPSLVVEATAVETVNINIGRCDPTIESAVYATVVELTRLAKGPNSTISLGLDVVNGVIRLCSTVQSPIDGIDREMSPLVSDRIGAIGGESLTRRTESDFSFDALVPVMAPEPVGDEAAPVHGLRRSPIGSARASNEEILTRFLRSGLYVIGFCGLFSLVGLATTRTVLSALPVVVIACLMLGSYECLRRASHGEFNRSVGLLCVVTSTTGVVMTLLIPAVAPATGLLASLPLILGLPHFRERTLDVIAFVQTLTLTAVAIVGYVDRPVLSVGGPRFFPIMVVPIVSAVIAVLVASTMTNTNRVVSEATEAVRSTLTETINRADVERQSMERDLHDGAQQQFVAISMQFRSLAKLLTIKPERAYEVAAELDHQLCVSRNALVALATGNALPDLALGRLGAAMRTAAVVSGQNVEVLCDGVDQLDPDVATAAYYCCHEALQNAIKHGGPTVKVIVRLSVDGSVVRFEVIDNGIGFDPDVVQPGRGFQSLEARITALGGSVSVVSRVGEGTAVRGTLSHSLTSRSAPQA
jgi:signal transduction histidine kinase